MDDSYVVRSFSFRFSYLFGCDTSWWGDYVCVCVCYVCVLFFFLFLIHLALGLFSLPSSLASSLQPYMLVGLIRFGLFFFSSSLQYKFCLLYAFLSLYLLVLMFSLLKSRIRIAFISLSFISFVLSHRSFHLLHSV